MNKLKKKSFTLTELLIVISIIALLIALLVPSMKKVMYKARIAACVNQIKQLSTGVLLYADNYNDFYPRAEDHRTDAINLRDTATLIYPYWNGDASTVKPKKLLTCPQGEQENPNKNYYGFYYTATYNNNMRYNSGGWKPIENMMMRRLGDNWNTGIREYNILVSDYLGQSGFNQVVATNHMWGGNRKSPVSHTVRNNFIIGSQSAEFTASFGLSDGGIKTIIVYRGNQNHRMLNCEQIDSGRNTHIPIELSQ
jgi:type II secretory pathway pseudopilin PulG